MKENYSFDVFEIILPEDRENWMLYIDAIYKSDPIQYCLNIILTKINFFSK